MMTRYASGGRSAPHPTSAADQGVSLTPLQTRVVRETIALVRREDIKAGDRLAESVLAARLSVSRTPVNMGLRHLTGRNVLAHNVNCGYSPSRDAQNCPPLILNLHVEPDEPLYLRIVEDRLAGNMPDTFSEPELTRRYGVARKMLRAVLSRIQQER